MMKYLFTVKYKDGSFYHQNAEDRSATEPDKRSCFFDVKQDEVATFTLEGEGHTYSVNLIDGHFEVNGVPFAMHEEALSGFRLIFFRQHTHNFIAGSGEEIKHDIVYRLGWQCTVNGENVQRVMQID